MHARCVDKAPFPFASSTQVILAEGERRAAPLGECMQAKFHSYEKFVGAFVRVQPLRRAWLVAPGVIAGKLVVASDWWLVFDPGYPPRAASAHKPAALGALR